MEALQQNMKDHTPNLNRLAKATWPTVVSNDDNKTPEAHLRSKANMPGGPRKEITSLQVMAKATWSTPKSALSGPDNAIHDRENSGGESLPTQANGVNPSGLLAQTGRFVERLILLECWMMGQDAQLLRLWPKKAGRKGQS